MGNPPQTVAEWMPVWDAIRGPRGALDRSASISSLAEIPREVCGRWAKTHSSRPTRKAAGTPIHGPFRFLTSAGREGEGRV